MSEVANTIAAQIGNRAFVMMGAKNLVGSPDALRFAVGSNPRKVGIVSVTLDPTDTYTVAFFTRSGLFLARKDEVMVEALHAVIEAGTGLLLSL